MTGQPVGVTGQPGGVSGQSGGVIQRGRETHFPPPGLGGLGGGKCVSWGKENTSGRALWAQARGQQKSSGHCFSDSNIKNIYNRV